MAVQRHDDDVRRVLAVVLGDGRERSRRGRWWCYDGPCRQQAAPDERGNGAADLVILSIAYL
jgi:hypothetical protein